MKFEKYLESVKLAGSHAKGTDLRDSDVDLFLSYSPNTPGPLSAIRTSLADHFHGQVRNVAVRITYKGLTVDLVPARGNILWQARFDTWLKTDIDKQIQYVRNSGLIDEILALRAYINETDFGRIKLDGKVPSCLQAVTVLSNYQLQRVFVQRQVRHQPFQPGVLIPQLLQLLRLGHFQTAALLLPGVDGVLRHAHLPRHLVRLPPGLHLLHRADDLRFRMRALAHPLLLPFVRSSDFPVCGLLREGQSLLVDKVRIPLMTSGDTAGYDPAD